MAHGRGSPAPRPGSRKSTDDADTRRGPRVLRVVVADDNRLIISGIRRALEGDDEIEIVAEAYSGADVLPVVDEPARTSCCSTSGSATATASTASSRSGNVIPR